MSEVQLIVAHIKAMCSAEMIMRDSARRRGDKTTADMHGDRAQMAVEILDSVESLLIVDLMENSALIEQRQAETARLRAAIEKHRQLVSNHCHVDADPNEELWSVLEPKP